MNEEEARERCKQIIKDNNEIIKEARKNRDINSMQLTASLDNDSIAIETALNLLEKKDIDIIEAKEANRQLSVELQKKDKIINLMAEEFENLKLAYFKKEDGGEFMGKYRTYNKNDWKQYFERKVENG